MLQELAVRITPRVHGVSKYGIEGILKGFLDLFTVVFLTRFRYRPQHLLVESFHGMWSGRRTTYGLVCLVGAE